MITKELLRELGDWRVDKEGQMLAESGGVQDLQFNPPILSGDVRTSGGVIIKSRLKFGTGKFDVENLCRCRQAREDGIICAHVVALVYAYLNKDKVVRPVPVAPVAPAPPPPPRFHRATREDAAPNSPALELAVLLPLDFAKAWKSGEMRIILEAGLVGGPLRPLATIPLQPAVPYLVSEADARLFNAIEFCNGGLVTGIWGLKAKDYDTFFTALTNHPRVMLGKRSAVTVHSSNDRPKLFLELQPSGELKLRLADNRPRLGESLGTWSFTGSVLERTVPLPPVYQVLAQGEMTLSRMELARFYEQELPNLEKHVDLTTNDAFEHLNFTVGTPRIRATLDGVLEGLSIHLEAVYGEKAFPLQGGPKPATADWNPNPAHPLQYWKRDTAAETRAQRQVIAAGFEPDARWPEMYTLRSENRGGSFLANVLPKWRAQWDIVFGTRMQAFLAKCEIVQPEIAIRPAGNDWLAVDIKFKNPTGESSLTQADVQQLLKKGVSHVRMGKDRVALVPTDAMHEFQEVVFDCDAQQTSAGLQIDRRYGSYLGEALQEAQLTLAPASTWKPPVKVTALQEVNLPGELRQQLRHYQHDGVNWLHHLAQNGLGGVLADEMGLGKTIQTLAYLLSHSPALVICPTSLLANWQSEAARFTPSLKTLVLHGPKRHELFSQIPQHNLIITSYALLRRDAEMYAALDFKTVILDEAQNIKNPFSQNAQAAKVLRAQHRFVLTGTPMENSLTDLWSIFDFLMPGYLGRAAEFKDRYEVPITKNNDAAALRRLRQRLRPFVLRRTKAEVAKELPAKLEQVTFCEMSEEQKSVYQSILDHGRREVSAESNQAKQRMAVLTTLTRLRQACCHLELLPPVPGRTWEEPSAKLEACLELIDEAISGGHRVLVFSQFVKLLQLVVTALQQRDIPFCYLDGSTIDRQGEVRRFQESPEIPLFLISLKAGGTGLNLTGADTVIHFDPWWNPAVEDQATARAHRIGQTNIVTSYKLIAQGSVEEKIVKLQEKKKDLIASALTGEETFAQNLTWDELQGLLT